MNIDLEWLRSQMDRLAKDTLKVVSASSLKLFSLEVEDAAKKCLQSAIEEEYNKYSKQFEGDQLSKFLDLSNGYLVNMNTWMNQSKIQFPQIPVMEEPDECNANSTSLQDIVKRREVQVFGLGTAISIILMFSGVKFIAFVTEAVAVASSIYLYKRDEEEKRVINEKAKEDLENKVNSYISSVISNTQTWITKAENQSDFLISTYK
jgi:hypothetical protein